MLKSCANIRLNCCMLAHQELQYFNFNLFSVVCTGEDVLLPFCVAMVLAMWSAV
jgi:hypothetical protein